jgi:hypothetical protein
MRTLWRQHINHKITEMNRETSIAVIGAGL